MEKNDHPLPGKRRKSAAERRAQRLRAEARMVQRLLRGFAELSSHRGCCTSLLGDALARALIEHTERRDLQSGLEAKTAPASRTVRTEEATATGSFEAAAATEATVEAVPTGQANKGQPEAQCQTFVWNASAEPFFPGGDSGTAAPPDVERPRETTLGEDTTQLEARLPASKPLSNPRFYLPGEQVRLHSLVRRGDLNGLVGTVLRHELGGEVGASRVAVQLNARSENVRVGLGNLELTQCREVFEEPG